MDLEVGQSQDRLTFNSIMLMSRWSGSVSHPFTSYFYYFGLSFRSQFSEVFRKVQFSCPQVLALLELKCADIALKDRSDRIFYFYSTLCPILTASPFKEQVLENLPCFEISHSAEFSYFINLIVFPFSFAGPLAPRTAGSEFLLRCEFPPAAPFTLTMPQVVNTWALSFFCPCLLWFSLQRFELQNLWARDLEIRLFSVRWRIGFFEAGSGLSHHPMFRREQNCWRRFWLLGYKVCFLFILFIFIRCFITAIK